MDLKEFGLQLLRKWWIALLAVIITTISTVFVGMQQTPVYQAASTVELLPSPALGDNQMINVINVLANRRTTINTYARKATGGTVKERVAEQLGVPVGIVNAANISASVWPETTLIEIRARANDPQLAADISNAVAQELIRQAPDKVMVFELVDFANPVSSPVEPQSTRLLTIGVITGVVLGGACALALVLFERFLDTRAARKPAPAHAVAEPAAK